ncbi:unnamed protein product [Clonostachys solani]|uniref:Uncharacterized protein n=1 Tax=Clonostachys solani TaxID=160281 RepID=A0A9N9W9P2_9HYPO|nr:unnamed protein product [Clonostachys solani]
MSNRSSPGLTDLISSYAILPTLATWVSTVDLYHLALTNRVHHSHILGSPTLFKKLRSFCLCDGRGLIKRQNFQSPYRSIPRAGEWTRNSHLTSDEEIEVKLYNAKCDEGGALPCVKCGINICEECRYYRRAKPSYQTRRPHLDNARQISNIMCLCPNCDSAVEEEAKGQFLYELCNCDPWARWICTRCKTEESVFDAEYFGNHTLKEFHWEDLGTGENEDPGRRNRERGTAHGDGEGESSDLDEQEDSGSDDWDRPSMTIIDHAFEVADPDYPNWTQDGNGHYPNPYPKLGYTHEGDDIQETSV